jgi:hypothetical protein
LEKPRHEQHRGTATETHTVASRRSYARPRPTMNVQIFKRFCRSNAFGA